jgi:hypothetical protein
MKFKSFKIVKVCLMIKISFLSRMFYLFFQSAQHFYGKREGSESVLHCFLTIKLKSMESFSFNNSKAFRKQKGFAVGRIRTYAPRGNLISSQTP